MAYHTLVEFLIWVPNKTCDHCIVTSILCHLPVDILVSLRLNCLSFIIGQCILCHHLCLFVPNFLQNGLVNGSGKHVSSELIVSIVFQVGKHLRLLVPTRSKISQHDYLLFAKASFLYSHEWENVYPSRGRGSHCGRLQTRLR